MTETSGLVSVAKRVSFLLSIVIGASDVPSGYGIPKCITSF